MATAEKILVGCASLAMTAAVVAVLAVVPGLYNTINEVHDQVREGVEVTNVM